MTYQIVTSCQNQHIYAELKDVLLDLNVELVALAELPLAGKKKHRTYYSSKQRLIYAGSPIV